MRGYRDAQVNECVHRCKDGCLSALIHTKDGWVHGHGCMHGYECTHAWTGA